MFCAALGGAAWASTASFIHGLSLRCSKTVTLFFFFEEEMKLGYGPSRILGYEKFGEGHVVYTLLPTSLLVISKKEM